MQHPITTTDGGTVVRAVLNEAEKPKQRLSAGAMGRYVYTNMEWKQEHYNYHIDLNYDIAFEYQRARRLIYIIPYNWCLLVRNV